MHLRVNNFCKYLYFIQKRYHYLHNLTQWLFMVRLFIPSKMRKSTLSLPSWYIACHQPRANDFLFVKGNLKSLRRHQNISRRAFGFLE